MKILLLFQPFLKINLSNFNDISNTYNLFPICFFNNDVFYFNFFLNKLFIIKINSNFLFSFETKNKKDTMQAKTSYSFQYYSEIVL